MISDIMRSKVVLIYTLVLALLSWSAFGLEDRSEKGLLTILNIILFSVPLMSILFSAIYLYNGSEFIELLVCQPVRRKKVWQSLFASVSIALVVAFLVGAGIPLLIYAPTMIGLTMLVVGILVSLIFIALGFVCVVFVNDRAKGIGMAIMIWLYFTALFDSLLLFLVFQFSDYPIETPLVFATALNPIDLVRIQVLLHLNQEAILGYTGAIFKDALGKTGGMVCSLLLLMLWVVVPLMVSLRKFDKKDL